MIAWTIRHISTDTSRMKQWIRDGISRKQTPTIRIGAYQDRIWIGDWSHDATYENWFFDTRTGGANASVYDHYDPETFKYDVVVKVRDVDWSVLAEEGLSSSWGYHWLLDYKGFCHQVGPGKYWMEPNDYRPIGSPIWP